MTYVVNEEILRRHATSDNRQENAKKTLKEVLNSEQIILKPPVLNQLENKHNT